MSICVNSRNTFNVPSGGPPRSINRLEQTSAIMCEYCMHATKVWCIEPFVLLHVGENKARNSTLTICTTAKFYCEW